MRTTIDISDRDYVLSHMRSPRGLGSWAFRIEDSTLDLIWTPSMTYSDAKVWARAKVRDMQHAGTPCVYLVAQP